MLRFAVHHWPSVTISVCCDALPAYAVMVTVLTEALIDHVGWCQLPRLDETDEWQ